MLVHIDRPAEGRSRNRADPDDDDIGGHERSIVELDRPHSVVAVEAGDARAEVENGAARAVGPGKERSDLGSEHTHERCREWLDDRH